MVVLTVISAFTRQATFIVAGSLVVAWLAALLLRRRSNRWAVPALSVAITALATQVLQTRLFPTFSQLDQFKAKTGADNLTEALLGTPRLAWKILRTDLVFFAQSDRALLVLITLSIVSSVVFWRRAETHLLIGAVAGTALYGITNGTPTAFRYAMPGLVCYAVSVALLMSSLASRVARQPDSPDDPEAGRPQPHPAGEPQKGQQPALRADRELAAPSAQGSSAHDPAIESQRPTDGAAGS